MIVSVVIPVRNDAKRLQACLDSLSRCVGVSEIIVVDNGSFDESGNVARLMGASVVMEPFLRVGALRNRGVATCKGNVLAFVDSDHELPEDWIENGLRGLDSDPTVVAVGAPCLPPLLGTWVQTVWAIHRLRGPNRREVDWLGAGNLFVRRSAFVEAGGFNEDLVAAEDVDLCYRLKKRGGKIILDRAIRNIHHGEPKTVLQFLRKEYWRGSSSLKAWFSQGCPKRDIPNLLWPLWFGGLGIIYALVSCIAVLLAITSIAPVNLRFLFSPIALLVSAFIWILPAILLAVKVCWRERRLRATLHLAILYALFGIARFAAMVRSK
jgi:cellulose synthase/poly-beta-1,6-N-acetylglucosamine synthase-like glycosyltransferase